MKPTPAATAVTVDPENPWLGLFSYSEDTLAYFHGRDEETGELCRRVQRKLLTVLFGQSGLGKTSLLRAGIVPRLRAENFCPVYVRIDYAPTSPAPSEQIKQAIFKATAAAGFWTRPGTAIEGESLWEFMHHRGDLLRDASGRTLIPLLIFDQFEEIFTLGQADDAGRMRAKQFLQDLGDLVENRPPAALEARIEDDDAAAEDFDFARADYRVLIALREDYLAHLEGVKGIMPSITQNRMRLARMTGAQALSAVVKPGGRLVSQEVAESIVRFVAGGSELANAEIEPSLLSLVCRELNTVRLAQGRSEISADLLAGSRDTILSEFYERTLADQPAGVRRVIEDELLTESGYRESLAEERVIKDLAAAGAAPEALAILVDRRLLRIEERLDMRRVELTHDVLCSVVLASRNLRQEREARDAAQAQLAAQQEREAATHRALVRARAIASVCIVLALLSIASAVFGWISQQRARSAEAAAQKSRSDAEKLVNFLIEDFYNELAPTGRLETLGKLAHMTVSYYDGLPPELVTPRTEVFRAMALAREGAALDNSGHVEDGVKRLEAAGAVFEKLYAAGDHSEPVVFGLALVLQTEGNGIAGTIGGRYDPRKLKRVADLLKPYVYAPNASRRIRQLYGDDLNYLSHAQPLEQGVVTCDEARKVLETLGATKLADLDAAASYADTADSEARFLLTLGRVDEARKLEQQVYDLADKLLTQRPGDLHSMADRSYASELLSAIALRQHDDAAAADYAGRTIRSGEDEIRFNPSDLGAWARLGIGFQALGIAQFEHGDVAKSIATMRAMTALEQDPRRPSSIAPVMWFLWFPMIFEQAQSGDGAGAEQSVKGLKRDAGEFVDQLAADDPKRPFLATLGPELASHLQLVSGDAQGALANATTILSGIEADKVPDDAPDAARFKRSVLDGTLGIAAPAAIRLGRYAQAEIFARQWLALPPDLGSYNDQRSHSSLIRAVLAHAMAAQGRLDEARSILQPALDWYRLDLQAGAKGITFRHDFAYALYVDALSQAADAAGASQRSADLADAQAQIDGASDEAKRLVDMRYVSDLIAAARAAKHG
ncbi:MAG TPA: hypothetical protein VK753_04755 [Xanthomonadaceae bacterium]|jgi:tetratricopeptide (TPR) repeat protein|nr:hypothetical protein [Xanthomonadaceae bacterium]